MTFAVGERVIVAEDLLSGDLFSRGCSGTVVRGDGCSMPLVQFDEHQLGLRYTPHFRSDIAENHPPGTWFVFPRSLQSLNRPIEVGDRVERIANPSIMRVGDCGEVIAILPSGLLRVRYDDGQIFCKEAAAFRIVGSTYKRNGSVPIPPAVKGPKPDAAIIAARVREKMEARA